MATLLKDETVCSAEYNEVEREANVGEARKNAASIVTLLGASVAALCISAVHGRFCIIKASVSRNGGLRISGTST